MTDKVRAAAEALVAKIHEVTPHTKGVYTLAMIHGQPYRGPTYEAELKALEAALALPRRPAPTGHWSDCAVHNEPALPAGACDCGGLPQGAAPSREGARREGQERESPSPAPTRDELRAKLRRLADVSFNSGVDCEERSTVESCPEPDDTERDRLIEELLEAWPEPRPSPTREGLRAKLEGLWQDGFDYGGDTLPTADSERDRLIAELLDLVCPP